jgi:hypothetical protein
MRISITDIIKQSLLLYHTHTKKLLALVILAFIPGALQTIGAIILGLFIPDVWTIGVFGISFLIYLILSIALSLVTFWVTMTLARVLSKLYTGQATSSTTEEIRSAKHIVWPALGVSILSGLAVLGGTLLLVVPGIIFGLWFAFAVYETAIDGTRPLEAMRMSKQLVDGRLMAVLWRLLVPGLLFGVVMVVFQYIANIPLDFILNNTDTQSFLFVTWSILATLISSLLTMLFLPLTTSITIILYTELKNHPLTESIDPPAVLQA